MPIFKPQNWDLDGVETPEAIQESLASAIALETGRGPVILRVEVMSLEEFEDQKDEIQKSRRR